jgi:hypothetical protein
MAKQASSDPEGASRSATVSVGALSVIAKVTLHHSFAALPPE